MSSAAVVIDGVGAVTALGRNTPQTALMLRAGKRARARVGARVGTGRSYACRVRDLPDAVMGCERLAQLALPALHEALGDLGLARIPVVAALPSGDFDAPALLDQLARRANLSLDPVESAVIQGHHGAGIAACQLAVRKLQSGAEAVVVGGIDSLYREPMVRQLERDAHLTEGAEVVAGEGAAFVVLRNADSGRVAGGCALGFAQTSTLSDEALASLVASEERSGDRFRQRQFHQIARSAQRPADSDPLRTLLETVAQFAPPASWLISDASRRRPSLERLTHATQGLIDAGARHDRFGAQLGDLGAATAVVHLAVAYGWMRMGCAPADDVLIVSCEHERERGVLWLREAA